MANPNRNMYPKGSKTKAYRKCHEIVVVLRHFADPLYMGSWIEMPLDQPEKSLSRPMESANPAHEPATVKS